MRATFPPHLYYHAVKALNPYIHKFGVILHQDYMSTIDLSALSLLRDSISPEGSIHLPGDPDYSNKRWAVNAEKNAAAVAWPATPEDVVQILAFAQGKAPYAAQKRLHVAVKGGGHTPSGASSSDGGLVIDLQPKIGGVRVDPTEKLAYVGGGALWQDVDEATTPHGKCLASVAGTVGHTGVGGLTLGGGFGWLTGNHGLVIDNMVQATVITSSGDILIASDSESPDLFWAIRGGGGNFGVVTEFVLRIHPQHPEVYTSALTFLPSSLGELISEVNKWLLERTPSEVAYVFFNNSADAEAKTPHLTLGLQLTYIGEPEVGRQKFERFIKLGHIADQTATIPYIKLNHIYDSFCGHGMSRMLQGNFVPEVPQGLPVPFVRELFDSWVAFITENPSASNSLIAFEFHHYGKLSLVPPDATAYIHRNRSHNIMMGITWVDPNFNERARQAILDLNQAFTKCREAYFPVDLVNQGGYTNYMDEESRIYNKEFTQRRFGANYPRLMELKNKYDPGNIFGRWLVAPSVESGER
ncbi:unnamed protein product [Rhizoctonia solani]|uniref:FAD-binding PCMH-type domain-containing protein n=1 Tax=Rhizoctonia solani TaxID=456999 RepID=A0A8H3E2K3_9AGAM|nr:unnamed protein product [Rhizoctonia solani]